MKDIDQIRRENMARIEADAGGPTAAAALAGMSQAQWSNLRSGAADSKTGKQRGMRKETARKIEAGAGKPLGWLDLPPSSTPAPPPPLTPQQQALLGLFGGLTDRQREDLIRELEAKKQQNDELLSELLRRGDPQAISRRKKALAGRGK